MKLKVILLIAQGFLRRKSVTNGNVTKTRNGEWGMGNGEWRMENEEWGMGNNGQR